MPNQLIIDEPLKTQFTKKITYYYLSHDLASDLTVKIAAIDERAENVNGEKVQRLTPTFLFPIIRLGD